MLAAAADFFAVDSSDGESSKSKRDDFAWLDGDVGSFSRRRDFAAGGESTDDEERLWVFESAKSFYTNKKSQLFHTKGYKIIIPIFLNFQYCRSLWDNGFSSIPQLCNMNNRKRKGQIIVNNEIPNIPTFLNIVFLKCIQITRTNDNTKDWWSTIYASTGRLVKLQRQCQQLEQVS